MCHTNDPQKDYGHDFIIYVMFLFWFQLPKKFNLGGQFSTLTKGGHFSRRPIFKEAIFLGGHFSVHHCLSVCQPCWPFLVFFYLNK